MLRGREGNAFRHRVGVRLRETKLYAATKTPAVDLLAVTGRRDGPFTSRLCKKYYTRGDGSVFADEIIDQRAITTIQQIAACAMNG